MRVLVTGATGSIGRAVVDASLAAGDDVTAITRASGSLLARPGLTVVAVDPTDRAQLGEILPGHDAVIHCIGIGGRGDGGPTTVVSDATAALTAAMMASGVSRLVALSNVGAGSSARQGGRLRRMVDRTLVRGVFLRWLRPIIDDKNRMEQSIAAGSTRWTIVRLPNVVDRAERRCLRVSSGDRAVGLSIGTGDLAGFLHAATRTPGLIGVALSVSN